MVATIIYCFSEFKSSIREIEKLCILDLRVTYIMEQEQPSDSAIKDCINKYKFLWRPIIFHKRLDIKIKQYILRENMDIDNIPT